MRPKISIIIPTKDRPDSLRKVLDSLEKQIFRDFEIVIVDGGTSDVTRELIKRNDVPIILIRQTKKGLVGAVNEGWRKSKGKIIIRTDDDIVATPQWLQEISRTFNDSDTIGGVTGPTIMPDELRDSRDLFYFQKKMKSGNMFWRSIGAIYFNYFMEGEPFAVGKFFKSGTFSLGSNYTMCLRLKRTIEVDHHEACNMAIRRHILERIKGFDPIFTGVGEYNEADASFKIRELGYKIIFNPRAIIYHIPSKAGVFGERTDSYTRMLNFVTFYFKHIEPNNIDKLVRFSLYLLFLNGFYIYKFLLTKQRGQLGCIKGTIMGLTRALSNTSNC